MMTVSDYVKNYEFRFSDGGSYTPSKPRDLAMLEDAIEGYLALREMPGDAVGETREVEYYVQADRYQVVRCPKGSTFGNEHVVVAECAIGENASQVAMLVRDTLEREYKAIAAPVPSAEREEGDQLVPIYCKPWRTIVFVKAKHKADFLAKNSVAPSPSPAPTISVKSLEWVERVGVSGTFDANTSIGHFIASITDDDRGIWFIVGQTGSNYTDPDIAVVKAAAQAGYESRIRAALAAQPAQAGETK